MTKQAMANARIPEQTMMNYFQKLFIGALHGISNSDEPFLREYLESNLVDKILESNKRLESKGLFLKVSSDIEEDNKYVSTFCELIDGVVIQGIGSDREKNGNASDYHSWSDLDDMGIAVYTHNRFSNPENFIDPKENKSIFDEYEKVLVRLLLSIKTPYVLNVMRNQEEKSEFKLEEEEEQSGWNPNDYDFAGNQDTSESKYLFFLYFGLYHFI